jgi:tight adherence protein C
MSALSALVPVVPGAVALLAILLLLHGWRLFRSDGMADLEVADLVLLRSLEKGPVGNGPLGRVGERLVPGLRALLGPGGVRWLQRQVNLAGRLGGMTVDSTLAYAGMWLVMVSPLMLMFLVQLNLVGLTLCLAVVLVLPLSRLARLRRLRRERLDRDLPDFLDILSVTVAAGVGFRPALARVADRMGGPLAEEMTLALNQIANGASRRSAFQDLKRRTDSEAMNQFVTAFLQAEELGAPIVDTLRTIAVDMRRTSAQLLRRRAARTAPRVTLVTSLVLVPGAVITVFVGLFIGSGINFGSLLSGTP